MRGLSSKEYKLFEQLAALTQKEMHGTMNAFLKSGYKNVVSTDKFIYAEGTIPIALVAHMDTVFANPATDIYYDPRKNVLWSPDGLGADDRAGIFAIVQIVMHTKLRPHIILTTDEERGCIGANELAKVACPFKDLKYIIQLDRRGANDCVFYDCFNPKFTAYIESFGFVENWGSYSDISSLCPAWQICGVNLSIGYYDEHSVSETLHVGQMFDTIEKVKKMLMEQDIPTFEYKRKTPTHLGYLAGTFNKYSEEMVTCKGCGVVVPEWETFPVKGIDGRTVHYCIDCIPGHVEWCEECQEPYELDPEDTYGLNLCPDCVEALLNETH